LLLLAGLLVFAPAPADAVEGPEPITTVAGSGTAGSGEDSPPTATGSQLNYPFGVAVDGDGNVYIADTYNHRVRKVATDGSISTVAGTGTLGNGEDSPPTATGSQLKGPLGVAVDGDGNLYIVDSGNHRVRKVRAGWLISTVVGTGTFGQHRGFAANRIGLSAGQSVHGGNRPKRQPLRHRDR